MQRLTILAAAAFALVAAPAFAQAALTMKFADPAWDGKTVPKGQQCPLQGGMGATPPIDVSGLPDGTTHINVAFNDETYQPMNNGGHGIIGFDVTLASGEAHLPSVPGNTAELPQGASVTTASRGTGDYASPGYLPPCSGGNGNLYTATVTAVDASGKELASGRIELGHY
jgi:phosphatidylethanolamine-binding protein (PEBP) family uncharacterized protein